MGLNASRGARRLHRANSAHTRQHALYILWAYLGANNRSVDACIHRYHLPSFAANGNMATFDSRLVSFSPRKPRSTKKSAVNAFIAKGWPHPQSFKADPSTLAHAGFYFDPTPDKGDNVTCFACECSLADWTSEDDPFEVHLQVNERCLWAVARCSIELDRQRDGRCADKYNYCQYELIICL